MRWVRFIIIVLLVVPYVVAQGQDFSISALVGVDTTPPSVPSLLSVEPIASSQIDVSWSTSTDDFFLTGYVLYRDDVAIATTSLTSFSDTGLTPSTTYSYYVQSFDSALNYSATSSSLATTTFDVPPPPVTTATSSRQSGTFVGAELASFSIVPGVTSAAISLETVRPSRIQLRWGRTANYELGYVTTDVFSRAFQTNITDLEPGTTYEYQVIGYSVRNIPTTLRSGTFTTAFSDVVPPSNVRNLRATVNGEDVSLTWELPTGELSFVRVVRNHLGYPASPQDGAIVYQGLGESYVDQSVLADFERAYYTVFTYGIDGAISSGAAVVVSRTADGGIVESPGVPASGPINSDEGVEIFDSRATTTDVSVTANAVRIPTREEIHVRSGGVAYTFASPDITIETGELLTVSIARSAVSDSLKTILFTLTDPTDNRITYSYILRLNQAGTAYEAVIEPFFVAGRSEMMLIVYDYEARLTARYYKRVQFGDSDRGDGSVVFPDVLFKNPLVLGGIMIGFGGILLLLFLVLYLRRR